MDKTSKTGPKSNWKLDPEVVRKLESAFLIDCTVKEACIFAGISRDTYYRWIKENPELGDRFELMKTNVSLKAKMTIFKNLDNIKVAQWYMERNNPEEFGVPSRKKKPPSWFFDGTINLSPEQEKRLDRILEEKKKLDQAYLSEPENT